MTKSHPTAAPAPPAVHFDSDFAAKMATLFQDLIVFNRTLGLKITEVTHDSAKAWLPMRPELIGHPTHQRLHGGVISATLDALGGLAVMGAIGARHMDEPVEARLARFGKLGTIDLRVDYFRHNVFFPTAHKRSAECGFSHDYSQGESSGGRSGDNGIFGCNPAGKEVFINCRPGYDEFNQYSGRDLHHPAIQAGT